MKAIRKKLNSSAGASVFIGLLFFLLCATVGAVVLTAAMANGGRLADLRASQQSYLDVRSAARLLRDEVATRTFEVVFTQVSDPVGGDRSSTDSTAPGGALGDLLGADAQTVYGGGLPSSHSLTVDGIDGMGTVTGVWAMDGAYNVVLTLSQPGEEDAALHPMTLTIPAQVTITPVVSYEYVPYISGYENDENGEPTIPIYSTYTITTTVTTTTVTWQLGDIDKGGT